VAIKILYRTPSHKWIA